MKMNKFFMLGLAGLAFAACSNEESVVDTGFPKGEAALSIRLISPTTKTSAQTTDVVTVTGPVVITVVDDNGQQQISLTQTQLAEVLKNQNPEVIRFWNVNGPQKVIVQMNGGQKSYSSYAINKNEEVTMIAADPESEITEVKHSVNMQSVSAITAYGETSTFKAAGTGTPDLDDDVYETGASQEDVGHIYEIYQAEVQLEIPVARLEVSGICHTPAHITTTTDCGFATLTIDGVYMDNIMANGASVAGDLIDPTKRTDYKFPGVETGVDLSGVDAVLSETISSESFLQNKSWPVAGQTYGYNFYAPTAEQITGLTTDEQKEAVNPKFKIYFATATGKDGNILAQPRYAMITKYKDTDGNGIVLTAGTVYRITSAELSDDYIISPEGGEKVVGVEVVVTQAQWTVKTITAEWEQ